ncbi:MAG: hypothetical protein AAFR23_05065, partial [Pseudomonadota bacterium]
MARKTRECFPHPAMRLQRGRFDPAERPAHIDLRKVFVITATAVGSQQTERESDVMSGPRVAIVGIWLESNRIAPVAGEADFRDYYWFEGADVLAAARAEAPIIVAECAQFVRAMDATGDWDPVPILITGCHP